MGSKHSKEGIPGREKRGLQKQLIKEKNHKWTNGDVYSGVFVQGRRSGTGVYKWKDSKCEYHGEWKNGRHHGLGKFSWEDGDYYEGEFFNDRIHGKGLLVLTTQGEQYEGNWKSYDDLKKPPTKDSFVNSHREGFGVCEYISPHACAGAKYEGQWLNDAWDGLGKLRLPAGNIYEGMFVSGKMCGRGVCTYDSGTFQSYNGQWQKNEWHGDGKLTYTNGDVYEGDFKEDARHGTGIFKFINGDVFEGKFQDDEAIFGVYKSQSGDTYEGHFVDEKYHGYGCKVSQTEGWKYEGEWREGVRQGLGKCEFLEGHPLHGVVYEGEWYNDNWHGKNTTTYSNGDKYSGSYHDNMKNGVGTYTFATAELFECRYDFEPCASTSTPHYAEYSGDFVNDRFHGTGKMTYGSESTYYKGEWKDGKRNGKGDYISVDLTYSGDWIEDEMHGEGSFKYLQSGESYTGGISNGAKHGYGVFKYANGDEYDGQWENGTCHGKGKMIWKSTQTTYEGDYFNNQRTGYGKCVFNEGTPQESTYDGEWMNDTFHGSGTWIYPSETGSGQDKYAGEFNMGQKHGNASYTRASDGSVHTGMWDNGIEPCTGQWQFKTKDVFLGTYSEFDCETGKRGLGHGEIKYIDGGSYTGDVIDSAKHGHGKLICFKGGIKSYEGSYNMNQMDGRGKLIYTNGDKYEGQFSDDCLHGQGILTYANGDSYEGGFEEDFKTGQGTLTFASGGSVCGLWEKNKLNGKGYYENADKSKYEGDFVDHRKQGSAKCSFSDGSVYEGPVYNGKLHGFGKYTYANGDEYEGEFDLGKKQGVGTYRVKADDSVYVGEFKGGDMSGKGRLTYADGSYYDGEFKNNAKNGFGVYVNKKGYKTEGKWVDGKPLFSDCSPMASPRKLLSMATACCSPTSSGKKLK